MSAKKQLLDPLGTMFKLISLNFTEINTKISIQDHVLSLDRPYGYQFFVRMINGDGRENISELFYVVVRVIKWYMVYDPNVIQDDLISNCVIISHSQEIKQLVRYACEALRKLQQTYEYGNVVLAIQFYINILEDAVNDNFNNDKLPRSVLEKEREFETLIDYNKLRNMWDLKKLKTICNLYENCFDAYHDTKIDDDEKNMLLNGYVKSIHSILEMADTEFQKLILNSYKG